jgi:hypothetical protein
VDNDEDTFSEDEVSLHSKDKIISWNILQQEDESQLRNRPTPPPRSRKNSRMSQTIDGLANNTQNLLMLPIRSQQVTDLDEDFVSTQRDKKPSTIHHTRMDSDFSDSHNIIQPFPEESSPQKNTNESKKRPLMSFLTRPTLYFVNWMSSIANNVEIHSYPP